jgi:hypothetical protein
MKSKLKQPSEFGGLLCTYLDFFALRSASIFALIALRFAVFGERVLLVNVLPNGPCRFDRAMSVKISYSDEYAHDTTEFKYVKPKMLHQRSQIPSVHNCVR